MTGRSRGRLALLGKLGGVNIITTITYNVLWKHSIGWSFSVSNAYKRGLQVLAGVKISLELFLEE
uniref:Putative ovule protein n=1 Tax=Solanum chacoense TaxID=4108 RepID=A0A0V0GHB9_SOLCH